MGEIRPRVLRVSMLDDKGNREVWEVFHRRQWKARCSGPWRLRRDGKYIGKGLVFSDGRELIEALSAKLKSLGAREGLIEGPEVEPGPGQISCPFCRKVLKETKGGWVKMHKVDGAECEGVGVFVGERGR